MAAKLRLNPLVSTNRVRPSGETAMAEAWPAVNVGNPGRFGSRLWNTAPRAAVGVIAKPVGVASPGAAARTSPAPASHAARAIHSAIRILEASINFVTRE